jgi:small subunit ribosomal protein S7
MPRRYRPPKREVAPDSKYQSVLVSRFVRKLMQRGKKSTAERILYDTFDLIEKRTGRPPLEVFEEAIANSVPVLEVKPRRVGGATYQVPVEVSADRRTSLAIRWIIQHSRARSGRSMAEKLGAELMDAAKGVGVTIKRKEDTHKMAEANRAFAHYRW